MRCLGSIKTSELRRGVKKKSIFVRFCAREWHVSFAVFWPRELHVLLLLAVRCCRRAKKTQMHARKTKKSTKTLAFSTFSHPPDSTLYDRFGKRGERYYMEKKKNWKWFVRNISKYDFFLYGLVKWWSGSLGVRQSCLVPIQHVDMGDGLQHRFSVRRA